MVASLFGVQNLIFPWEIPLFSIDFWNVQWAISPLVSWRLVAQFVKTGLICSSRRTVTLSHKQRLGTMISSQRKVWIGMTFLPAIECVATPLAHLTLAWDLNITWWAPGGGGGRGTQFWVGYECAARSFDHHPITKPEKTQIWDLCLNHLFREGPFFKPISTFYHVN